MARVNVYLPDELARQVREAGLNVSAVAHEALVEALALRSTDRWLDGLERLPRSEISPEQVIKVLDDAHDEFGA